MADNHLEGIVVAEPSQPTAVGADGLQVLDVVVGGGAKQQPASVGISRGPGC